MNIAKACLEMNIHMNDSTLVHTQELKWEQEGWYCWGSWSPMSDSPSGIHGPLLLSTIHIFSRCSFIPPAQLLSLLFPLTHSHLKLGWPLISPQACPTHSSSSLQDYSSCQAKQCRKARLVPCSCPDASRTQLLLASVAVFWRGFLHLPAFLLELPARWIFPLV